MSLSEYEKSVGALILCGQDSCKGKESCARWKYRNRKSGGYVLVLYKGESVELCDGFERVRGIAGYSIDFQPWMEYPEVNVLIDNYNELAGPGNIHFPPLEEGIYPYEMFPDIYTPPLGR